MNLGSFMSGLGSQAGLNMQYQQQQQAVQQQSELEGLKIQEAKFNLQQQQEQAQNRLAISAQLAQPLKSGITGVQALHQRAENTRNLSLKALAGGDTAEFTALQSLATGYDKEVAEQKADVADQYALANSALADASQRLVIDPTNKELRAKAEAAYFKTGGSAADIPTDPVKYQEFFAGQRIAAMNTADKGKFVVEQEARKAQNKIENERAEKEFTLNMAEKRQAHADQVALRRSQEAHQQFMANLETLRYQDTHQRLLDQEYKNSGLTTGAVILNTSEALRGVSIMLDLPPKAQTNVFNALTRHTALSAMEAAGGNALTPEDDQMMTSLVGGAGIEVSRALAAQSGGRAPTQAQGQELQNIISPQPGDSTLMKLFRTANMVDMLRVRNESVDKPKSEALQGTQKKNDEIMAKIIKPSELIAYARLHNPAEAARMLSTQASIQGAMNKLERALKSGAAYIDPDTGQEVHRGKPLGAAGSGTNKTALPATLDDAMALGWH